VSLASAAPVSEGVAKLARISPAREVASLESHLEARMAITMPRITFSAHAKDQMQRRGITREDVRAALSSPHITYPGASTKGDTVVSVGTALGGRELCVVVADDDPTFVVTAYWKEQL
jgi:hypothetical protein